jgi:regulator of replication initiation timing
MNEMRPQLAILNLTGELGPELTEYFSQKEIEVIDPLASDKRLEWTHILTKDIHDFNLVSKTYGTLAKDIKIVSLTAVNDPQNFILCNGKLILDEIWLKGPMGKFILDKFFQGYSGISLADNYPTFKEKGTFNVANPFGTGEYLDRMVQEAFIHGSAGLSIKTFFDHIMMYLVGLKNKNKAGLPFEITFGTFDQIFAVQIHFFSENILMEDVTSCLSSSISKKAEEYLLNISVQAADFLDFSFLTEVKKVVITGLWTQDERVRFQNRGLMFANVSAANALSGLPIDGVTSQLTEPLVPKDFSERIELPKPEENTQVSGEKLTEALAEQISSSMEIDKIKQMVKGEGEEDTLAQHIAGIAEEEVEDDKVRIKSKDELQDIVNMVKGTLEEEKNQLFKVGGGKLDVDNFAFKISSGLEKKASDNNMQFKSLGGNFPEAIKSGLFDFAKKLNKDVNDLTIMDIDSFKELHIPQIIKDSTKLGTPPSQDLMKDLRDKLGASLKNEFMEDSLESILSSIKSPEDEQRLKELLKSTLKNSIDATFNLSQGTVGKGEQDLLVKSLSTSLNEDESKLRDIISDDKLLLSKSFFDASLAEKLKNTEEDLRKTTNENESLKGKLKTLMTELKVFKDSKMQLAAITSQAQKLADAAGGPSSEENTLRKLQFEVAQKEILFSQEIENTQRQLKSKELMLSKTRESVQKISEQKDKEINDLKMRLDQVSKALATGPNQGQQTMIRDLEKQNHNLNKMLEVYKLKVQSLANKMQSSKTDDGSAKEEARKLSMLNTQLQNQHEMAKKELQKWQDRSEADTSTINQLRQEKIRLEQQLKKAALEAKQVGVVTPVEEEAEHELKKFIAQNQVLENQLKESSKKLAEAEAKLAEALKNTKVTAIADETAVKGKLGQLEANVKKLTQDLSESRNQIAEMKKEANKLRQEKTALQNQMDKFKKDAEKAEKSGPASKKPGSKAA